MKGYKLLSLVCASLYLFAARGAQASASVQTQSFGMLPDGRAAHLYTLHRANGFVVQITDYGAAIVSIKTADRAGEVGDVVLGFSRVEDYIKASAFVGTVVGRVANRIANARFELDGKTYALAANNSPGGIPCSLHGGKVGFDKVIWQAQPEEISGSPALRLDYFSKDGEEGFPGNLKVSVVYSISNDNSLRIDYSASTDAATPVNLSNHSYFNLRAEGDGTILSHQLTVNAHHYTPVNRGLIPTGKLESVKGTPFDFMTPRAIGEHLGDHDEQLRNGNGYDHNFVLDRKGADLELAARVYEPEKGRVLEVLTTEPGLQFYSGNFLNGAFVGKSGKPYPLHGAFVLETQHFPDSINQPNFPTIVLRPGAEFKSTTVFRFSTQ